MSYKIDRLIKSGTAALFTLFFFTNCSQSNFAGVAKDPGTLSVPADKTSSVQYLLLQSFIGGMKEDGQDIRGFVPTSDYKTGLNSDLSNYVEKVKQIIQPTTISIATNRKYGFAFGPLPLDLPDQDLAANIRIGFDVAIAKKVPVAFHFDVSHFWKLAQNSDGTLLSASRGIDDNREWKDWGGTIADSDNWQPKLLPSMCFECRQVKALVDRVATNVIATELKAGLARLKTTGDEALFAGAIIGWEAGSDHPLGYHSLSLKGYDSSSSLAQLNKANQKILHDYLQRWTRPLVIVGGIAKEKIYTHTANVSKWDVDNRLSQQWDKDSRLNDLQKMLGRASTFSEWLLAFIGNGADSYSNSFNDYANGGYSIYPNSFQEGQFEAAADAAQVAVSAWGMCEGTNTTIEGKPSEMNWETYLGKIFNHGATLASLFGLVDATTSVDGYGAATGSSEAAEAYRKFLRGEKLIESGAIGTPAASPAPTAAFAACPNPLPSSAPTSLATACNQLQAASRTDTIKYPFGPINDAAMLTQVLSTLISTGSYANAEAVIQQALASKK